MKRQSILFCFVLGFCITCGREEAVSQSDFWQQTKGPYGVAVTALSIDATGKIFAGTSRGGVFTSTDNGESWVNSGLTYANKVRAFATNASGHIFAGTDWGGVFRSIDNGASWMDTGFPHLGVGALLINANGDIFVGTRTEGGPWGIFRSTDNGASWVNRGLTNTYSLAVNANGTIFAGGDGGSVYRSTDNGTSWKYGGVTNYNSFIDVEALAINASGHIFAGTHPGSVIRSTDDGASWQGCYSVGTLSLVNALVINSSGTIFAALFIYDPPHSEVLRSTDNGASWTQVSTGLTNEVAGALAIDGGGFIFAGTDSGGVFRSVQSTITVKETSADIPFAFSLEQNFPNPFNPTTTIKFSIPSGRDLPGGGDGQIPGAQLGSGIPDIGFVSLKVYDLLGREVATLVADRLAPGRYERTFDARGHASGVYLYKLEARDFVSTKKLILIH